MSWIRVSDDFTERQEFAELGDVEATAGWTYLRLMCWSASHLSDGFVPVGVVRREDAAGVAALERIGYVSRRPDGGVDLPRFLTDHALSRDAVLELREKRAEAGSRGGLASARARAEAKAQATAEANGKHGAKHGVKQNGNPVSRIPSPGIPEPVSLSSRARRAPGKRGGSEIDGAVTRA
jgi:hypothetical protein